MSRDIEHIVDDLYTLSILWEECTESPELARCRYFIGWQMVEKAKKLYELYHADDKALEG